ncbi:hypothetical protein M9Y10_001873 [Tritrichomonas musculus]|uniref:Small GTP-binding protein n=1 Tax=Tritrichomonas musculus TaxID=1915356 RepID=A0ABR2L877_9EUKA
MNVIEAKVVFLGSASVGKTCIVNRATSDYFDPEQVSTVGASFSAKRITTEKSCVTLRIWDTAGQERYRSLAPMYFHAANAVVVVFSLNSIDTLEDAATWVDELKEHYDEIPLLYLVGNKADLTDERTVSIEQASDMADKLNASYLETSAKTGQNINELFEDIAYHIEKAEPSVPVVTPTPLTQRSPSNKGCC